MSVSAFAIYHIKQKIHTAKNTQKEGESPFSFCPFKRTKQKRKGNPAESGGRKRRSAKITRKGAQRMAKIKNAHIGRPPKYNSPEEMQEKIDAYFEECKGHVMTNSEGEPVMDKFGRPIVLDAHPPTVTGLALALGFVSRQSLLMYQGKKSFVDTITRAKARVERYAEERLFDRDGSNGAKFSLQNNFTGWIPEKERAADTPEDRLSDAIDKITAAVRDGG